MTYLPAVLVTVVLTGSTLGALYPVAWVRIVARAPRSYAILVLVFFAALIVGGLLIPFAGGVLAHVPVFGGWLQQTLIVLLAFAQACLVGGFLHRHADDLGF
jgi:MFS family permease